MNSFWRSFMFSGERCRSSTKPLIEVSGLRSSCEAVATNSLLARSNRARSVVSRTVQTTPSSSWPLPSREAVTDSVLPPCSTDASRSSASSSGGSGLPWPSTRPPTVSSGTSSPTAGLTAAIVLEPGSVTINASRRLSIVTARRCRSASRRRPAVWRASPMALKAVASSWSSRGPDGLTRRSSVPEASSRVAETSSSSGLRMAAISADPSPRAVSRARAPAMATMIRSR